MGSHFARKGACTHASLGTTVAPPIVSICLFAMWSIGSVKKRHLHYEKLAIRTWEELSVEWRFLVNHLLFLLFSLILQVSKVE